MQCRIEHPLPLITYLKFTIFSKQFSVKNDLLCMQSQAVCRALGCVQEHCVCTARGIRSPPGTRTQSRPKVRTVLTQSWEGRKGGTHISIHYPPHTDFLSVYLPPIRVLILLLLLVLSCNIISSSRMVQVDCYDQGNQQQGWSLQS